MKKGLTERIGDWLCLNCKNHNFSFRKQCNRCMMDRDEVGKVLSSADELATLQNSQQHSQHSNSSGHSFHTYGAENQSTGSLSQQSVVFKPTAVEFAPTYAATKGVNFVSSKMAAPG